MEKILKVGFVGWRGMVGSVLMDRMLEEGDFANFYCYYFSTSQIGEEAPIIACNNKLWDAYSIKLLKRMDIIVTCQGSDYTEKVYQKLRDSGWKGYWIDAASYLRMKKDAVIVLDPVNLDVIKKALKSGKKTFVGGNCTVSLMLMVISGIIQSGWVEWITSMTYQAASGAGAKYMMELARQMVRISTKAATDLQIPSITALELDRNIMKEIKHSDFPIEQFGVPLATSLIPWIDKYKGGGQTKEEWKGGVEARKILGNKYARRFGHLAVDGLCVRVGSMRCHSQALTIKLRKNFNLPDIIRRIECSNGWVRVIPNKPEETRKFLTPVAVSGKLEISIGRIHRSKVDPTIIYAFTVGDQLLWGAAEPIRRMLNILIEHLS